jgi:RHS repeat-associated protein
MNNNGSVDSSENKEENNYYPFGLEHKGYGPASTSNHPYKFGGKEFNEELGLDWYDVSARNYDPALGRWMNIDPFVELYFAKSPYIYALNTPINAIDDDGNLVIFINGNHFGDGASGYTTAVSSVGKNFKGTRDYWKTNNYIDFDSFVMAQLGDYNAMYRDGSIGGYAGLANPGALRSSVRKSNGTSQGEVDAATIIENLERDEGGNIIESIKIISHSMGGSYAKGYAEAILQYAKKHDIKGVLIAFEADFAPYQSAEQKAVKDDTKGPTLQFSHDEDSVAGNDPIKGAEQKDTSDDKEQGHSIFDFYNQIKKLPSGNYKVEKGKIIPE